MVKNNVWTHNWIKVRNNKMSKRPKRNNWWTNNVTGKGNQIYYNKSKYQQ